MSTITLRFVGNGEAIGADGGLPLNATSSALFSVEDIDLDVLAVEDKETLILYKMEALNK